MLTKKQERRLQKHVRDLIKSYKKRKKLCAKQFPDWCDDEFNQLENRFVWALLPEGSKEQPSFHSLNDAIVYYNRITENYIFDVDLTMYNCADRDSMQRMIERLERIEDAFAAYLLERKCPIFLEDYDFSENFTMSLMADNLTTLRFKLGIIIAGIKHYYAQTFLDKE